jgi:prolyl-tRNA editing enzyme YbaK/EbsC (Cys-tRNA(Pro) deacylase)
VTTIAATTPQSLPDYLRLRGVRYVEMAHRRAFDSVDVASASSLGGRGLAKVVAVRDRKGEWLIAVLPAPMHVDLEALALASGKKRLWLASERDMKERFGSKLPSAFAEISGLPVYVDHGFADWSHIYFEADDHRGVIGLRLRDYVRMTHPLVGRFARPA